MTWRPGHAHGLFSILGTIADTFVSFENEFTHLSKFGPLCLEVYVNVEHCRRLNTTNMHLCNTQLPASEVTGKPNFVK